MRHHSWHLALLLAAGCAKPATDAPPAVSRAEQTSGTTALLQAVSIVDDRVVWVSGHRGTYVRTTDGGATWQAGRVPGADTLQFRDVHAVDSMTAYLMSAGNGALSRIYKTTDGGRSWALQFTNTEAAAFYDCFAFWDARRGVAFSDAVDGQLVMLATEDGGARWSRVSDLPAAQAGEGAFAASGGCVVARPDGRGWVGMGNAARARVLRTSDYGRSWTVVDAPLVAGEAAGIAAVAFRDGQNGIAVGGHIGKPETPGLRVARTRDGGATWTAGGTPRMAGPLYGAVFVPRAKTPTVVAVGPSGADWSRDGGATWVRLDTAAYWSVGFASPQAGWAVGPNGRITRFGL